MNCGGNMQRIGSRQGGARDADLDPLLEDIALLCDGPGLTVRLGRDLGTLTLKSEGRPLYAGKGGRTWKKVNRRTRAKVLLAWIREAASVARGRLLMGSSGTRP